MFVIRALNARRLTDRNRIQAVIGKDATRFSGSAWRRDWCRCRNQMTQSACLLRLGHRAAEDTQSTGRADTPGVGNQGPVIGLSNRGLSDFAGNFHAEEIVSDSEHQAPAGSQPHIAVVWGGPQRYKPSHSVTSGRQHIAESPVLPLADDSSLLVDVKQHTRAADFQSETTRFGR